MNMRTKRGLLASAARTATTTSPKFDDKASTFVRFYLNVTAASGTGGLKVVLRGYDQYGVAFNVTTGGTAITATGTYIYELGPSVTNSGAREAVSTVLPTNWDAQVVAGDSSSYTYTLSAEVA